MTNTEQPTPMAEQIDRPPEPMRRPNRRARPRSKVTMAVAAAAIGIAGAGLWSGCGSAQTTAAQVRLESTSSAGANPFMSSVGRDQPNVTPPANSGGVFAGNTPGLFADTGDQRSCDAQNLIINLQADPTKASAWAGAMGLQPQDIPSYVASLTPVVLRSDTSVTSYGYADGQFFAYPAVLQAGTAVFVNSYGEPKVKCFNGAPLTAPVSYSEASYVGPAWANATKLRPNKIVCRSADLRANQARRSTSLLNLVALPPGQASRQRR